MCLLTANSQGVVWGLHHITLRLIINNILKVCCYFRKRRESWYNMFSDVIEDEVKSSVFI